MATTTTDILKNIPLEELPQLIDYLIVRLGRIDSNHLVNLIKNVIDWFEHYSTNSYITITAPDGDWRTHATFIVYIDIPDNAILTFYSLEPSNEQLLKGLMSTKRICWDRDILFASITDHNYPVVYRITEERNLEIPENNVVGYLVRINKEDALKYNYSCPDNTTVHPLRPSDAILVNDVWPSKSENTMKYIATTIERNDNMGLFMHDTKELASWAVVSFQGAISFLQTADAHKKKGYASIVTMALAEQMARRGWDPCASIRHHNVPSQKVFARLGFEKQSQEMTFFFTTVKDKTKKL